MRTKLAAIGLALAAAACPAAAQEATIAVRADRPLHKLSRYHTGACIEDVNHEIYGGLYSQMIFGESFQEPAPPLPIKGFRTYGGRWQPQAGGELHADGGDGPKLISDGPELADGEVGVEIFLPQAQGGNAGLILKVSEPGTGADRFTGYEVSVESAGKLVLGRHRQNWEHLRDVPCPVPVGRWIPLVVRMTETTLEVFVDGRSVTTFEDTEHPLRRGRVGLRTWQRPAHYRNLWIKTQGETRKIAFEPAGETTQVSGMWRPVRTGTARGDFAIETERPFVGKQSQRLTFEAGEGTVGVENQGLNRWGLGLVAGKPYEGYLWARADRPAELRVALERRDGSKAYAETRVAVRNEGWTRYDFTLTPEAADAAGRLAIALTAPGSVVLGHAFLQPGAWGRFRGLPDRKDVAEALIDQGITVLRYGGSMINHPEYRWKKMIGPRDRRPPSPGTWYPYSSNGWGIFDFLSFCEAAGFLGIPAVFMGESPQDMADFVEYANGPADSAWGRKRAEDGHPAPYRLKHLELGNEEAVNDAYWEKFRPMAEAIWAKDPEIILVVGDFAYGKVIDDPFRFEGGVAVKSLAAHKKILDLARQRGREVWFDIHITTERPPDPRGLLPERSYIEQLGKISPGANYKVAIFEFNSGNHAVKRALANACAIHAVQRLGDVLPVALAANCLQPDGQNDNGWDQGLLFLNPSRVWLQPPGYVTRMVARNDQPLLVPSEVRGAALDVTATRSEDARTLVLKVVNIADKPVTAQVALAGFTPSHPARVETLAGPLEAVNTAQDPTRIRPTTSEWRPEFVDGKATYTFPAHSFSVIRLE